MPLKIWKFNELLCGYLIQAYDKPKQISKQGDVNYLALPLEKSPIYCVFSLISNPGNTFTTHLAPVPDTRESFRETAIQQALIKWITTNLTFIFNTYRRKVIGACNGNCPNLICMEKSYDRNLQKN
jgi:hypothetical protein